MRDEENRSALRDTLAAAARRTLVELSDDLGLATTSADAAAERLLGVVHRADGTGVRVDIGSDGLGLDTKLALERALRARLAGILGPDAAASELVINFRRQPQAPGADTGLAASGPAPLAAKKSPFGLTIDKRAIPGVSEVIVVASGKGGVGKSTVSVNLAVALARAGARVGLLDADIYGPSAPLMLGLQGTMAVTAGGARLKPREAHGVKAVSFGFLTDTEQPVIWRGPMLAKALHQLVYDTDWGSLDYLVVDLPPGTGDVQLSLIETVPIHGALVVTTPQDVALLDAHKAVSMFERLAVPILGLVENMAHFSCPHCGHAEPIFGSGGAARLGQKRGLPVLAQVPLAGAVRARGDDGRPVALDDGPMGEPFRALARLLLDRYR